MACQFIQLMLVQKGFKKSEEEKRISKKNGLEESAHAVFLRKTHCSPVRKYRQGP
jgi:hypothetical protein